VKSTAREDVLEKERDIGAESREMDDKVDVNLGRARVVRVNMTTGDSSFPG
jgi:hypothetical protein